MVQEVHRQMLLICLSNVGFSVFDFLFLLILNFPWAHPIRLLRDKLYFREHKWYFPPWVISAMFHLSNTSWLGMDPLIHQVIFSFQFWLVKNLLDHVIVDQWPASSSSRVNVNFEIYFFVYTNIYTKLKEIPSFQN